MLKSTKTAYNNNSGDDIMFEIFNVAVHPCTDTTGYWATCDMPNGGCTAQAKTVQEIQKDMLEAVDFYLEDYPEITNYYLKFEVHNA